MYLGLIWALLAPTLFAAQSEEDLRKKLFPAKETCQVVTTVPKFDVAPLDPDLQAFLVKVTESLTAADPKKLQPLFHKRLEVKQKALTTMLKEISSPLGRPVTYSMYRLWALNTADGTPQEISCDEGMYTVRTHYGYNVQFGLLLQAQGQRELGRLYLSVVPSPEGFRVGAFNFFQWTHSERDFQKWVEEGNAAKQQAQPIVAFAKYDIATKLLEGGEQIKLPAADEARALRDSVIDPKVWETTIKDNLKEWQVETVGTILASGGAGLLVRIRVKEQLPHSKVKETCEKVASQLAANPWANYLTGVRCNFLLPKEPAEKDGVLGGLYRPFKVTAQAGK